MRGEGYAGVGVKDGKETGDGEEVDEWKGISQVILGKKEWFDAWLDGERRCTSYTSRLRRSLADADAFFLHSRRISI